MEISAIVFTPFLDLTTPCLFLLIFNFPVPSSKSLCVYLYVCKFTFNLEFINYIWKMSSFFHTDIFLKQNSKGFRLYVRKMKNLWSIFEEECDIIENYLYKLHSVCYIWWMLFLFVCFTSVRLGIEGLI